MEKKRATVFAIARANCDNPDFFTDAVYATRADAIRAIEDPQLYGDSEDRGGEWLLLEVAGVEKVDRILKAKCERVKMADLVAAAAAIHPTPAKEGEGA